jgi:hypothetical protein
MLSVSFKMENLSVYPNWSPTKKIAFRFVFIFFTLFILINNNATFPYWDVIFSYPTELLHTFIPWIGKHILALPYEITTFPDGSGDTTYDYVVLLLEAVVATLGTVVWSFADKKRAHYTILFYWLTVAVRFYVGLMLINYGLFKIIKLQFPSPSLYRLSQPYGDSSPMGLAWTFLGFSKGYNYFMGIAEIAAVLLLFRRTLTFGAIITLMTALNVMAVNYFFDIPVKILSTALVVFTLFLLLENITCLWKFFFTNNTVSLQVLEAPVIKNKWLRIAKNTCKALVIGHAFIFASIMLIELNDEYGENAPKPPLYGMYEVDVFIRNSDTIPSAVSDSLRWKQLFIENEGYAQIRRVSSKTLWFSANTDTLLHKIELKDLNDTTQIFSFAYEVKSLNKLNLKGRVNSDSVSVFMTRKTADDFILMNRGFHWINEQPFNR